MPRRLARGAALLWAFGWVYACGDAAEPPPRNGAFVYESAKTSASATRSGACGDVIGAWSSEVDGLRGRLVTSGSNADRSGLRVSVELESTRAGDAIEIHWAGRPNLGYVKFHLDEPGGREVPEPDWRLGGNEPGGNMRELIRSGRPVLRIVADPLFADFNGKRIVRIGAFWAREMPSDGSRRFVGARLTGEAPTDPEVTVGDDGVARVTTAADERGRVWTGPLELPSVCIE